MSGVEKNIYREEKMTRKNLFIDKLLKPKRNGTTFCVRDVDVYYLMIVKGPRTCTKKKAAAHKNKSLFSLFRAVSS